MVNDNMILKYFFISIMPEQKQTLADEITEIEKIRSDMDHIRGIFNSFEFMAS